MKESDMIKLCDVGCVTSVNSKHIFTVSSGLRYNVAVVLAYTLWRGGARSDYCKGSLLLDQAARSLTRVISTREHAVTDRLYQLVQRDAARE